MHPDYIWELGVLTDGMNGQKGLKIWRIFPLKKREKNDLPFRAAVCVGWWEWGWSPVLVWRREKRAVFVVVREDGV